jgi:hypothetical protein
MLNIKNEKRKINIFFNLLKKNYFKFCEYIFIFIREKFKIYLILNELKIFTMN